MDTTLDSLWDFAPAAAGRMFHLEHFAGLPQVTQKYLEHAIAPGTLLANAVRLRMHGEIKLKRWLPFTAEQVIRRDGGMIWKATVRMFGLPIRGFDRLIDGEGAMHWRLLGLIPIMSASGADITRSAAGRVAAELIWLPSAMCADETSWVPRDASHAQARISVARITTEVDLGVDDDGRLQSIALQRWGNPEGAEFHNVAFGGIADREQTFDGYTIPTRLRVGWYFGSARFESEGEFFRVTVDDARFR